MSATLILFAQQISNPGLTQVPPKSLGWGAGGQKQLNSVSPIVLTKLCFNQGEHLRYEEIIRPLAVQLINL